MTGADRASSCCHEPKKNGHGRKMPDLILWGSLSIMAVTSLLMLSGLPSDHLHVFVHAIWGLATSMWWGVAIGIVFVGLMNKVPREYFQALLGRGDTLGGIARAALAGVLLDLCSHGILLIGAKLYERGASTAQVMTFLIASPWNSFSLTLILIALIGLPWTLAFIACSAVIAIVTGLLYNALIRRGSVQENPNLVVMPADFSVISDAKKRLSAFRPGPRFFLEVVTGAKHEVRILLRWLLLGMVIAAAIRAFIPTDIFSAWFGPTMLGLGMTLVVTTLIEVCSEGSTPIAAEIFHRAAAPGNAFAFLMAGVATDYTEMMVLRETTKSWKTALFLPLLTVPQILILGMIMNQFG